MALAISGLPIANAVLGSINPQTYLDSVYNLLRSVLWSCPQGKQENCTIFAHAILRNHSQFGGPGNGTVIKNFNGLRYGWYDPASPPTNYPGGADIWVQVDLASTFNSMTAMAQAMCPLATVTIDPSTTPNDVLINLIPDCHLPNGVPLDDSTNPNGLLTWDQPYTHGGGYELWSLPMPPTFQRIDVQMIVTNYGLNQVAFLFADATEAFPTQSQIFAPRVGPGFIIANGWQFFLFLNNTDTAGNCCLYGGMPARDPSLAKLILAIGSDDGSGQNLRSGLYSPGNYWLKINNDHVKVNAPNQDPRIMQMNLPTIGSQGPIFDSLIQHDLQTADDIALIAEPFIAVSPDNILNSLIVGQFWDSFIATQAVTSLDQKGVLQGGFPTWCVGSDNGSSTRVRSSWWMISAR